MSRGFDDREKAAEAKWAHDEELRFKVTARRNKLLGLWAAGEMGLSGDDASSYAKAVVDHDYLKPGEEDVFEKIRDDFKARGIARTEHLIRSKMQELMALAGDQILAERKK